MKSFIFQSKLLPGKDIKVQGKCLGLVCRVKIIHQFSVLKAVLSLEMLMRILSSSSS